MAPGPGVGSPYALDKRRLPKTELGPNRHQGNFQVVAGFEPVEQRASRLLYDLARRRRAAFALGGRAQIVEDIDPGVETQNGYAHAPSDAEAQRTERARGEPSPCADLDVHRSEGVGLRREPKGGDGEARCSEKERETRHIAILSRGAWPGGPPRFSPLCGAEKRRTNRGTRGG